MSDYNTHECYAGFESRGGICPDERAVEICTNTRSSILSNNQFGPPFQLGGASQSREEVLIGESGTSKSWPPYPSINISSYVPSSKLAASTHASLRQLPHLIDIIHFDLDLLVVERHPNINWTFHQFAFVSCCFSILGVRLYILLGAGYFSPLRPQRRPEKEMEFPILLRFITMNYF